MSAPPVGMVRVSVDQLDWLARRLHYLWTSQPDAGDAPFLYDVTTRLVTTTTTVGKLVAANADRRALIFGAGQTGTLFLTPQAPLAVNFGLVLSSSFPNLFLNWEQHKAAVTSEWYGHATTLGVSVTVVEVIYRPERREALR